MKAPEIFFFHSACPFCPLCTPTLSLNPTLTLTPTPTLSLLLTRPPVAKQIPCLISASGCTPDSIQLTGVSTSGFGFLNAEYAPAGTHNAAPVYRGPAAQRPALSPPWSHSGTYPASGDRALLWLESGRTWNIGWAAGAGAQWWGYCHGASSATSPVGCNLVLVAKYTGYWANNAEAAAEIVASQCPGT